MAQFIRSFSARMAQTSVYPLQRRSPQIKCALILKDYQISPTNTLLPAKSEYYPFLTSIETVFSHPIGRELGYEGQSLYGSCFPVAPNIVATARHNIDDLDLEVSGYQVTSINIRTDNNILLQGDKVLATSKNVPTEKDPIAEEAWEIPHDYCFVRVRGPPFNSFLIPAIAKEGQQIVFPARKPLITTHSVADIKFAWGVELHKQGMSEEEIQQKLATVNLTLDQVIKFVSGGPFLQGEGSVLKIKHGLLAHDSPFYKGMSGSFGSVSKNTFSCLGISAGLGVVSPGSNYNVAISVDRDDFREDYASIVLPHLPSELRVVAENFLNKK